MSTTTVTSTIHHRHDLVQLSDVTNINYFTIFLQTANMALIFSK